MELIVEELFSITGLAADVAENGALAVKQCLRIIKQRKPFVS